MGCVVYPGRALAAVLLSIGYEVDTWILVLAVDSLQLIGGVLAGFTTVAYLKQYLLIAL